MCIYVKERNYEKSVSMWYYYYYYYSKIFVNVGFIAEWAQDMYVTYAASLARTHKFMNMNTYKTLYEKVQVVRCMLKHLCIKSD